MLLRVHGMARLPAAGSRPRDAEWAYGDFGLRTGVRNWPGAAFTFLEFCLQVVLPVLLRANGRATTRWLDIVNTDIDYRNFCINYNMDHNSNDSQGSLSGGGVQTRSRAVTGTRRTTRDKTATPRGPRGSRTPASVSKATPKDAETTGAPGSAEAKACTPVHVRDEGREEVEAARVGRSLAQGCPRQQQAVDK